MGAAASILTVSSIATTGLQTFSQYNAVKSQGEYQKNVYETNARFANVQAEDAIRRGDKNSESHLKQVRALIGGQRATLAAQNVEIDSGSPLAVQMDTAGIGALDALEIRNNAWRESWGFKVQSADFQSKARFAMLEARNKANNTLLTGGLQALNSGLNMAYYRQIGNPSTTTTTPTTIPTPSAPFGTVTV